MWIFDVGDRYRPQERRRWHRSRLSDVSACVSDL